MWIKAVIFSGLGIILGFVLPLYGGDTLNFFRSFSEIIISLGTYILIPLVLLQSVTTSYEIYKEKGGRRFVLRGFGLIIAFSLLLSLIGGLGVLLLSPERIPIIIEQAQIPDTPNFFKFVQTIFTFNIFQALSGNMIYLVAAFVFGILLGLGMRFQKTGIKPFFDFCDSFSRILQTINRGIVQVLLFGLILLSSTRIMMIRQIRDINLFSQVIMVILVLTLVVIFVIYPAILYFFGKVKRPWDWLLHALAPGLLGFFSGNSSIHLGVFFKSGKDEYNLPRRTWQWFYPASVIFCRAGTAMIASATFILIMRSYSSLEISFMQFIYVIFSSMLISLMLGIVPGSGILVSLSMLSSWYGQGLSEGFLILQPAIPILVCFAVLLDVVSQVFIATLLSSLPDTTVADEEERAERFREEFMGN